MSELDSMLDVDSHHLGRGGREGRHEAGKGSEKGKKRKEKKTFKPTASSSSLPFFQLFL